MDLADAPDADRRPRMRKDERCAQILLELKLSPHVRISELSQRFGVSTETVRRDFEFLSAQGLVRRDHGGATVPLNRQYPGFAERSRDRTNERERIGRRAAALVCDGDSVMIDSGSTTLQLARFIAHAGTACTVVTNSLPIATTIGQGGAASVILCPGDYLPSEAAVIGPDTIEFIRRHKVSRCFLGASALASDGVAETVRGFASIKRVMLEQSAEAHLLVDGTKFGLDGLAHVARLQDISSVVTDRAPQGGLAEALAAAGVEVLVAR